MTYLISDKCQRELSNSALGVAIKSRQFCPSVLGGSATVSVSSVLPQILGGSKGIRRVSYLAFWKGRLYTSIQQNKFWHFPWDVIYLLQVPAAPGLPCWAMMMGLGWGQNKGAGTCSTNYTQTRSKHLKFTLEEDQQFFLQLGEWTRLSKTRQSY